MSTAFIGKPTSRVDGRAKVTGRAKYAAEYHVQNLAYGWVISSSVARGKIARIDTTSARSLPGVLEVFSHENNPGLAWFGGNAWFDSSYRDEVAPPGSPFRPFHDANIQFSTQPVALVVADSLGLARHAASLVKVEYETTNHETNLMEQLKRAYDPPPRNGMPRVPSPRGYADAALRRAAVQVNSEYHVPVEHHNPMECFATTAVWEGDGKLTVYDKTQGCQNVQNYLCNVFRLSKENLRVLSPYVGGAFGSGLRPQYQVFLAVLAALALKRPVRVTLTRQQMFSFGHRPATWQRVALGAALDGTLEALLHEAIGETSRFEDYSETVVNWSGLLYQCDNVQLSHKVVPLDFHTPTDMRAPGAVWGVFALECAMDELAVKLGVDPVELRLKNYADNDQNENLPFSSKELRECYRQGAERFGWSRRGPKTASMRAGNDRIGWGMATGCWAAEQQNASAKAELTWDGKLTVSSATADIGTGTYTIMTQIAAEMLGLPLEDVTFKLGDSSLPTSPVEGGSWTASTIGSAVKSACDQLRGKLFHLAQTMDGSPLTGVRMIDVTFSDGRILLNRDSSHSVALAEVMRHAKVHALEEEATGQPAANQSKFARYSHSATFAEVMVDEDFGTVRVTRVVTAVAAGRILNPKTARSQVLGGIVWGIGSALEEESVIDHHYGRFMNHSLAEYHVPVNADIHDIEVIFVAEQDDVVNPLGVKGLGEIGIVGVAAAIANAVHHATGKRIRELPITPDKLL